MFHLVRRMRRRAQDGGSAVEYGLLVSGIAGVVAAAVFLFGDAVGGLFDTTCDSISGAMDGQSSQVSC